MSTESETTLEKFLIKQLVGMGYSKTKIEKEEDLKNNLKIQLEKFNNTNFTVAEFNSILNHLESGTVFNKAEKLRDRFELRRENGDMDYIKFFNGENFTKNIFQVSNQISFEGMYKNRYDVTILINGLPLLQFELKRRGGRLKEAFNQIKRYQKHSYHGLFNYIQVFVISNGVNTKYFANDKDKNFKFTFFWKDKDNNNINKLDKFTDLFLEKSHICNIISRYMVLNHTNKNLMILRAYQYYAVEAIVDRALNTNLNGYVWHTTGSGKTLTSFKVSEILESGSDIDKVIFVVDRRDLDYQTIKEFNSFAQDSVDGTENTKTLIKQLKSPQKRIITTIQKLSRAVEKRELEEIKDKRIVLMFDECHRSQFGKMHSIITSFFNNIQYFGFTGTPIFAENSNQGKTTHDIFGDRLHSYVIKDAIADNNVLGFSVEYRGKTILKSSNVSDLARKEVEDIDTQEYSQSDLPNGRLDKIANFIIDKHDQVTNHKEFNGLFAVNSVEVLKKYYKLFKKKIDDAKNDSFPDNGVDTSNFPYDKNSAKNLKIATIFSYAPNEDISESDENELAKHSREFLEDCISDYNSMFGTNFTTNEFGGYYVDLSKRFKDKEIDILIVVNMFLTGFDSKFLNTLYVDKNLEYHSLVQAYSRTNRIYNDRKPHGNIICLRHLKKATDKAIALFSDEDAIEHVLMKAYSEYIDDFNEVLKIFREVTLEVDDLNNLKRKEDIISFIRAFNELLKYMNRLKMFTEFSWNDLNIDEQTFEDYRSKYIDLYDEYGGESREKKKDSIIDDVEFEVDLIKRDYIDVSYIISLMNDLDKDSSSFENDKRRILDVVEGSIELKNKLELIEDFINNTVPEISQSEIDENFQEYIERKRESAFKNIVEEEKIDEKSVAKFLQEYEYSGKLKKEILRKAPEIEKLKFKEKRSKINEIVEKIKEFVDKFTF
ncbi:MAG: type I restriction endonuclease subunit R [Methanobacteriaceae archaeon]|jgi:type I restriction enzyme R subunit|nr:type I restriction endonuclease subunit R [Candidatus Methanorudis spinitermitis]